jgi:hypothetical protein
VKWSSVIEKVSVAVREDVSRSIGMGVPMSGPPSPVRSNSLLSMGDVVPIALDPSPMQWVTRTLLEPGSPTR